VFEADIRKFFDTISHEWLLENIPMDRKMLKLFLEAGFIESPTKEFNETTIGTPQGGPLSPTLANMTLDGLEPLMIEKGFRMAR
jgi:RNA-directed DNA polymerase